MEDRKEAKRKTGEEPVNVAVLSKIGVRPKKLTKADKTRILVERCQAGDQVAFRELFDEYVAGVHRHLSLLIGPGPDIDDLLQLVFLNVFNSIKKFKGQSAFSTWLFRITVNVARQEIRMRGRHRRLGSAITEVGKTQDDAIQLTPEKQLLVQQQVYDILAQLPVKGKHLSFMHMKDIPWRKSHNCWAPRFRPLDPAYSQPEKRS